MTGYPYTPQRPMRDYNAALGAFRDLVEAAGGYDAAATITRVGKSTLFEYGSLKYPGIFPATDAVIDLEAQTGRPLVTTALARLMGCELLPVNVADHEPQWARHLAAVGKEIADVFARSQLALSDDGDIDASEADGLIVEIDEALTALTGLRAALAARGANKGEKS